MLKPYLVAAALLSAACGQASGGTITAFYQSQDFPQSNATIGPRLYANVWLELDPLLFQTAADVTGTYTFADNLHWAALFNRGNSDYFVSSSQGVNFIDPSSFVTFDHAVITAWSIIGHASRYGTAYLESTSSGGDFILEPSGASAFAAPSGAWTQYSYQGLIVPGPIVGAGLPGLLIIGAFLLRAFQRSKSNA